MKQLINIILIIGLIIPLKVSYGQNEGFKQHGYINITELNYCPGIAFVKGIQNTNYTLGIRTINGYQFNEHLTMGLGVGIDSYKECTFYPFEYKKLVPITYDIRYSMIKGKVSPTIGLNTGYSIGLKDSKGGYIFNPSLGTRIYISKNVAYLLNMGIKLQQQQVNTDYLGKGIYKQEKLYFAFFSVNTGLSF